MRFGIFKCFYQEVVDQEISQLKIDLAYLRKEREKTLNEYGYLTNPLVIMFLPMAVSPQLTPQQSQIMTRKLDEIDKQIDEITKTLSGETVRKIAPGLK